MTVTATALREAAQQRYQAELSAIDQAESQAQEAQARLDALDRQKQQQAERQARRSAALTKLEQITQEHTVKVAVLSEAILNWRIEVENAARVLLAAREQGIKHRQQVMSALSQFASDASALAADIPEAELLALVADSALAMADFDLAPRIDARALRNLQLFVTWQGWLGHQDARTEVVSKILKGKKQS